MRIVNDQTVQERINKLSGPEFKLVSKYIDNVTKVRIRHVCEKCNNFEWELVPKNTVLKRKIVCPACNKKTAFLRPEHFLTQEKVKEMLGTEYILLEAPRGRKDLAIAIQHNNTDCKQQIFYASPIKIQKYITAGEILCPCCRKNSKRDEKGTA